MPPDAVLGGEIAVGDRALVVAALQAGIGAACIGVRMVRFQPDGPVEVVPCAIVFSGALECRREVAVHDRVIGRQCQRAPERIEPPTPQEPVGKPVGTGTNLQGDTP